MDATTVSQLVSDVVEQKILGNWLYWASFAGISLLIGASGAFLGSYFSKRGEVAAARADRQKILDDLRRTTETVARINSVVSLGEWSERERITLKRVKLEEVLLGAHKAFEWAADATAKAFAGDDRKVSESPMARVASLTSLYVPELSDQVEELANAAHAYVEMGLNLRTAVLNAESEVFRSRHENEHLRKAAVLQAASHVMTERKEALMSQYRTTLAKLYALSDAASKLMTQIVATKQG